MSDIVEFLYENFEDYKTLKSNVSEAETKGDDGDGKIENEAEFRKAAMEKLKEMFDGDSFDPAKAKATIDGLVEKVKSGEFEDWVAAYSAI